MSNKCQTLKFESFQDMKDGYNLAAIIIAHSLGLGFKICEPLRIICYMVVVFSHCFIGFLKYNPDV